MTTLSPGATITLTVPHGGEVSVSTNGGLAQVAATPAAGVQRTAQLGPAPARRTFGPYPLGAQLTITNTTCNSFIYDAPGDTPGTIATTPGQPSKPVLTAMAGAVSIAWVSGSAGSSATIANIWTDIYGNVTPLAANPQVISAPAGGPYTGTVASINARGAGPASPQADPVAPTAPVSILYPEKIAPMLAAIRASSSRRVSLAYHGMSITAGHGSKGPNSTTWDDLAWSTLSITAKISAGLNAKVGGTFKRGIETILTTTTPPQAFYTLAGTASTADRWDGAAGSSGRFMFLQGGATASVAANILGATAGQVVKLYMFTRGTDGGVTVPRYSMSGANTVAITNLPAQSGANPVPGVTGSFWYVATLTLANAGDTVITLLAATTTGQDTGLYHVDPDFTTTIPGLTIHRAAMSGATSASLIGAALDATDVLFPGSPWMVASNAAARRAAQTTSMTEHLGVEGVLFGMDINDIVAATTGVPTSLPDLRRHLTNYVTDMATRNLTVLFVVGSWRNPSASPALESPYTQRQIVDVYTQVAAASTNAAILDMSQRWPGVTDQAKWDAQVADTSRWLATEAPNYVHPAAPGHAFDGEFVAYQISKLL